MTFPRVLAIVFVVFVGLGVLTSGADAAIWLYGGGDDFWGGQVIPLAWVLFFGTAAGFCCFLDRLEAR